VNKKQDAFSESQALIRAILRKMGRISKPRQKFIEHILLLFMGLKCRYTFSNMSRFGTYSDRSYRFHFGRWFDFLSFNLALSDSLDETDYVIAFDPTYIRKSGRFTAHVDTFYNGSAMKRLRGLELGVLALIDRVRKTAFPLEAVQSHSPQALRQEGKSLVDHYAQIILDRKEQLRKKAKYLVVDGFFAKKKFILPILEKTQLHIVTMLRRDTHLQYLYQPKGPIQRGRPRKYDGKIDLKNPDLEKMEVVLEDENMRILSCNAFHRRLKLVLKIALVQWKNKNSPNKQYAVYAATDLELDPFTLYQMYTERFQIEFLIRDAKQHVGLQDCQARDETKLHFHFNTALTTIGIAKAIEYPKDGVGRFSMGNWKTYFHKRMMLNFFFYHFRIDQKKQKNKTIMRKLLDIGRIAA
jgi:hypothetical protein